MNMQCYTGGRMVDFLKIVCMLVIYLLVFTMSGTIANRVLGIKRSGGITIIMGFFVWFVIQEIFYIPMLLMKAKLGALLVEQIILAIVVAVVYMIFFRSKFMGVVRNILKEIKGASTAATVFFMVTLILVMLLAGVKKAYNTDYAHTVSSIEMAVMTGRMYMYDVDTGKLLAHPDYIRGFGVWNMNIAVWSSLLGVSAFKLVRYGMAWLGIILSALIHIRIGRQLFKGDERYAFAYAGTVLWIMAVFAVGKTPAAMLFTNGGTAQAIAANVLMPFVFYWAVGNRGTYKKEFDIRIIPIMAGAALAISVYSLAAVVFSILVVLLTDMIIAIHKKMRGVEKDNADAA